MATNSEYSKSTEWLSRAGEVVVGETLSDVAYVAPASADERLGAVSSFESVSIGVELEMKSGFRLALTWLMVRKCQGLLIGEGSVQDLRSFNMELRRVKVARSEAWHRLVGSKLVEIRPRWQMSEVGCEPTLWAVEFRIGAPWVMVALGELGPDGPRYQPDELIVAFGEEALKSYKIPAALGG